MSFPSLGHPYFQLHQVDGDYDQLHNQKNCLLTLLYYQHIFAMQVSFRCHICNIHEKQVGSGWLHYHAAACSAARPLQISAFLLLAPGRYRYTPSTNPFLLFGRGPSTRDSYYKYLGLES